MTNTAYSTPQYFLHDGASVSAYQYQTQFANFLTPPGGGSAASVLYTYSGSGQTDVNVPLNDIFGTTIELVDTSNSNTVVTNYTYDPNGVMRYTGARTPWPFLWQGLEQEYPDSWKLYWEPNENIYNPDPFELSLTGPQGLDGSGGGPHSSGGPGGNGPGSNPEQDAVNGGAVGLSVLAASTPLDFTPVGWAVAAPLDIFAAFDFFGGSDPPSVPRQEMHHWHPVYCEVLGICGVIVTQRGNITLAQSEEDKDDKEVEGDIGLGRIFEGQRPVIPYGGLLVPTEVGNFIIPEGSEIGPARNGRGYRFRTGKANPEEIRIMGPDPEHGYPDGYVRFYFKNQPVNPNTGKPVSDAEGHYKIVP